MSDHKGDDYPDECQENSEKKSKGNTKKSIEMKKKAKIFRT